MLRALNIRDVLIIDRLDLAFQPGLNVLTGETGAGKSILIDALQLAGHAVELVSDLLEKLGFRRVTEKIMLAK